MWDFSDQLSRLDSEGLLRRPAPLDLVDPQDPWLVKIDGKVARVFCSNDYLGLRHHPAVQKAATDAQRRFGTGSGSARQVAGDWPPLRELESQLASWLGAEAALLFSSGYLANLGAIAAFAEEGDAVFSDERNHASLVDGCRLSRARVVVYRHADLADLEKKLRAIAGRRRMVVSESVFSMDGDLAPVDGLAALCREQESALYLDEAHSLGTLPMPVAKIEFRMGTLSKTLASQGAFLAGDRRSVEILRNRARTHLFETALSPALAAAALAAIRCIQSEPERAATLGERVQQLRTILEAGVPGYSKRGPSPIFPLTLGEPSASLACSAWLFDRGFFVQAIRPPTVPQGTSRLRVTLSAAHAPEQVGRLGEALLEARKQFPWS